MRNPHNESNDRASSAADEVQAQRQLIERTARDLGVLEVLNQLPSSLEPLLQEAEAMLGAEWTDARDRMPTHLLVDAGVRYWEDATVNGVVDEDGDLIPGRDGDAWKVLVDRDEGRFVDWPEGTTADIHYKVCDAGLYWLADSMGRKIAEYKSYYVPSDFLCHGGSRDGDYIIMKVDGDGRINDYVKPEIDPEMWKVLPPHD